MDVSGQHDYRVRTAVDALLELGILTIVGQIFIEAGKYLVRPTLDSIGFEQGLSEDEYPRSCLSRQPILYLLQILVEHEAYTGGIPVYPGIHYLHREVANIEAQKRRLGLEHPKELPRLLEPPAAPSVGECVG